MSFFGYGGGGGVYCFQNLICSLLLRRRRALEGGLARSAGRLPFFSCMDALFRNTCPLVKEDMKGQFSLVELKMTHLDLLGTLQLKCEGMLTKTKAVFSGNAAAGDVVIYPSLASVRLVALRRFPGSMRSLFDPV